MIFITNVEKEMLDENVRQAALAAIDKDLIAKKLLRGYATPIDTLDAPGYDAYDPSIKTPYDPEKAKKLLAASGYSPEKPVKFTIQTTRGFKPKDYEMIQAIVGMWRKVGIDADIEVYEIAKHYELRTATSWRRWRSTTGAMRSAIRPARRALRCSRPRRTRPGSRRISTT